MFKGLTMANNALLKAVQDRKLAVQTPEIEKPAFSYTNESTPQAEDPRKNPNMIKATRRPTKGKNSPSVNQGTSEFAMNLDRKHLYD